MTTTWQVFGRLVGRAGYHHMDSTPKGVSLLSTCSVEISTIGLMVSTAHGSVKLIVI